MMVELLFPKKIRLVPPPSNTTLPPAPDPLVPVMKMETLDGTVISAFVQVAPLRVTVAPLTGDGLLREPFAGQAGEEAEAVAWLLLLAAPMTASKGRSFFFLHSTNSVTNGILSKKVSVLLHLSDLQFTNRNKSVIKKNSLFIF